MNKLKEIYELILIIVGISLAASFAFSAIRAMGHDPCTYLTGDKVCPNTPCEPFYIDKLEPLISTRWFCEVKK